MFLFPPQSTAVLCSYCRLSSALVAIVHILRVILLLLHFLFIIEDKTFSLLSVRLQLSSLCGFKVKGRNKKPHLMFYFPLKSYHPLKECIRNDGVANILVELWKQDYAKSQKIRENSTKFGIHLKPRK